MLSDNIVRKTKETMAAGFRSSLVADYNHQEADCISHLTGDSQPMDVCSVHHNDIFLRYSVSLLGYGFYGDLQADSERRRWLGPTRYDLSGMSAIIF